MNQEEENFEYKLFRISFTELKKLKEERNQISTRKSLTNNKLINNCENCNNSYKFNLINEKCQDCGRLMKNRNKIKNLNIINHHQHLINKTKNIKQFNFFKDTNVYNNKILKTKKENLDFFPINNKCVSFNKNNTTQNNNKLRVDKLGAPILKGDKNHKVTFKDEFNLKLIEFCDLNIELKQINSNDDLKLTKIKEKIFKNNEDVIKINSEVKEISDAKCKCIIM